MNFMDERELKHKHVRYNLLIGDAFCFVIINHVISWNVIRISNCFEPLPY